MQRIDTNDGKYHDADTLNGVQGTVVKAAALNALQEEIIAVITAAGITLDPAADNQLLAAIYAVTGNGAIAWGAITGKPATYPPAVHTQAMSTVDGLAAALAGKMATAWTLTAGTGMTGGGSGAANRTVSLGTPSTITASTTNVASGDTHTHEITLTAADIGAAAASHSHAMSDINGLSAALAGKMPTTWTITAGNGLTGGGSGATSRTVSLGTPATITGTTTNLASPTSHSHKITLTAADIGAATAAQGAKADSAVQQDTWPGLAGLTVGVGGLYLTFDGTTNTLVKSAAGHDSDDFLPSNSPVVASGYLTINPYASSYDDGSRCQAYWDGNYRTLAVQGKDSANTATELTLKVTGSITSTGSVTAPSFVSSASDPRCKHDIAPCRYGLREVLAADWIEYRFNPDVTSDQSLKFGSRTDTMGEVAPLLVIRRPDGPDTIDYTQIVGVLGKAIQEHVAQTDARVAGLSRGLQDAVARIELLERAQ